MEVKTVFSDERPLGELTEANLRAWLHQLPIGYGQREIHCGSPATEVVARRIVAVPGGDLYDTFSVVGQPAMTPRHWRTVAYQDSPSAA